MTEDRRLLARLATADRSLKDEQLPPRAVHRIANTISRELDRPSRLRRFGWIPMLTFVAGAALVLAFLAWDRSPPEAATESRPNVAVAHVSGPDCHHRQVEGDALELTGACEVVTFAPAMRIQSVQAAELGVQGRVVRMQRGSALFDVDPVTGDPVRIVVPGGEIVVVGTRFRVVVDGAEGQVDLYEGKLEFHADDGSVAPILAGEQFSFGRTQERRETVPASASEEEAEEDRIEVLDTSELEPASVEPEPESTIVEPEIDPEPRPRSRDTPPRSKRRNDRELAPPSIPAKPGPSAGAIIEEVRELRRRGEYERAATRLREALKGDWPTRTADVLSYELGTILARHLDDPARACSHWRRHLEKFRATRYRSQVEASIGSLGCR